MKDKIFEVIPDHSIFRGRKKIMSDADLLSRLNEIGEKQEHREERIRLRKILSARLSASRKRAAK